MDTNQQMQDLADGLWAYFRPKVAEMLRNEVSFFRAQVITAPSGGSVGVRKPMEDTTLSLPYVPSAASLSVGDQALVLVFGNQSNAIVLGNGTLSNL